MKKRLLYLFLWMILFFPSGIVYAEEYDVQTLIPIDTVATVKTEKFDYVDFIYYSQPNERGNCNLAFTSIVNHDSVKASVSINLLLFDKDEKNIGYLTYCSDKDFSSDNQGYKLAAGASSPYNIEVVSSRYFVEGKTAADVSYVAVMDENKYCTVGGYTKYKGLTIDKIIKSEINPKKDKSFKQFVINLPFLQDTSMLNALVFVIGGLLLLFANGIFLSVAHRKMYAKTNGLAFIPVGHAYVCAKLAFGWVVALIYTVFYLLATVSFVRSGSKDFFIFMNFPYVVCFVVVLLKLITKKYRWLTFEPVIGNLFHKDSSQNTSISNYNNHFNNNINTTNNSFNQNPVPQAPINFQNEKPIDLSYQNAPEESSTSKLENVHAADLIELLQKGDSESQPTTGQDATFTSTVGQGSQSNSDNNHSNDSKEGSDLSNFFS